VPGGHGISIKSYKGEVDSSTGLIIDLASGSPISTGTYSGNAGSRIAVIHYNVYYIFFWDEHTSISSSVTLTELDSKHVKGTFSGTIRSIEGTTKELTDGVFNVSF